MDRQPLTAAALVAALLLAGCSGYLPADSAGLSPTPGQAETTGSPTTATTVATTTTTATTATTPTTTAATTTATTATTPTTTATPTRTTRTPIYQTGPTCDSAWIALWGMPTPDFWTRDSIRVGVNVPADAAALLVVEANGSVVGVDALETDGTGFSSSGYVVDLDQGLHGTKAIRASVYADRNENGRLDPEVDRPCYGEYGVVRTDPEPVDFDAIANETA